jgi:hypothetical protein
VVKYVEDKYKELNLGVKRRIMIQTNSMEEDRMETKILEFLTYIVVLSSANVKMDDEDLETLIQGDFIEFGKFINL